MNSCINYILNWLFPTPCQLCDELLNDGRRLCQPCHALLPFFDSGCEQCGIQLNPDENGICSNCRRLSPYFDRTLTLFRYEKPADHWLQSLKFQQRLHLAPLLGELMWQQQQQRLQQLKAQWIIPLPLHRKRLHKRGFNQSLELSRPLAKALRLPIRSSALRRQRDTKEQSSLQASERPANVENAFSWHSDEVPRHVFLVDDIITTGHTANSAAKTMKQVGVQEVTLIVFARAQK